MNEPRAADGTHAEAYFYYDTDLIGALVLIGRTLEKFENSYESGPPLPAMRTPAF